MRWILLDSSEEIASFAQDDEIKLSSSAIHHVREFVVAWASSGEDDCKAVSNSSRIFTIAKNQSIAEAKQSMSTVVHSKYDSVNLHS